MGYGGAKGVLFFFWGWVGMAGGFWLEIFQTVPFCFQRKLNLCKCALCPFAYCLNCGLFVGSSQGPGGPMGPKRDQGGLCLNDSSPRRQSCEETNVQLGIMGTHINTYQHMCIQAMSM